LYDTSGLVFGSPAGNRDFAALKRRERVAPATAAKACGIPPQGPNDFSFLRKRKAFWISKEKWGPIGMVPLSVPAVLTGTVDASINRCRSSSQSPLFSARPVGQVSLRSLAPPLPIKPASLGFDEVPRTSISIGRLAALLAGWEPAALRGGVKPSKQHRAAAAERGASPVVRQDGGQ